MTGSDPVVMMNIWVVIAFLLVIALEIAIPLILAYLVSCRFKVSWDIFFLGLAFFVAVQIVHVPLVLLTQRPLALYLEGVMTNPALLLAAIAAYLGLMAGLFEEIGRYLVFTRFFPDKGVKLSRENALMFGTGWGGIESILIGILVSFGMISYIMAFTMPQLLLAGSDPAASQGLDALCALAPVDVLYGLAERIMTIILHIAWTLMVMYAVMRKARYFVGLAVCWHAIADFCAVAIAGTAGIAASEGVLFLSALAGLGMIYWIWPRMAGLPKAPDTSISPGG